MRTSSKNQDGATPAARLLADPHHREAVKSVLRRAVAIANPAEAKLAEAMLDPLLDRAARGQTWERGTTPGGGFGGIELEVLALLPLVLEALARLVREVGRQWPDAVARGRALPAGGGSGGGDPAMAERLRVVEAAICEHVASPRRQETIVRDFAIRIESAESGYRARVLPASGGSAEALFAVPPSGADLTKVLRRLERGVRGPQRHVGGDDPVPIELDPRVLGGDLYDALFVGGVRDAWRTRRAVARRDREVLRLRLVLDPRDLRLCALPWELLYDRRQGHFLAHEPRTPVVRQLALDVPTEPHLEPVTTPLRTLVVSAVPPSSPALAADKEADRVEDLLRASGRFEVARTRQATVSDLRRDLARHSPHVLHLIGHGSHARRGEAAAELIGPDNDSDSVTGAELAAFLLGCDELRLVVLNSCDSASLPRHEGLDAFSAMAPALFRSGLPAVIAMQFPISDRAAVAFSTAFYQAIGAGRSVETAVGEARTALYERDRMHGSFEWATPVFYLGVDHGDLFQTIRL